VPTSATYAAKSPTLYPGFEATFAATARAIVCGSRRAARPATAAINAPIVISSVMSERWAFAPYGIILHFRISFVRGAVKAGQWGEAGFAGELLAVPFQPSRSTIRRTGRLLAPSMPCE
jgi:hypothetical protein